MAKSKQHIFIRLKKAFQGLWLNADQNNQLIMESTITCPQCGYKQTEKMPLDSCVIFYVCLNCKNVMKPREGDCCVFCTYGDVPCPSKQRERLGVSIL